MTGNDSFNVIKMLLSIALCAIVGLFGLAWKSAANYHDLDKKVAKTEVQYQYIIEKLDKIEKYLEKRYGKE